MKQRLTRKNLIVASIALSLVACGGGGGDTATTNTTPAPTPTPVIPVTPIVPSNSVFASEEAVAVKDDPAVYAVEENKVIKASIVTTDGAYTFKNVNEDDGTALVAPEIDAHLEVAGSYPNDGKANNATLRLRGKSSRLASQKSYRVKLLKDMPAWRSEGTLQLNKHPFDLTRVRNKLAFDLFRDIPHIPSLRTQFMQVSITNKDKNGAQYASADYGLFTHVEKLGTHYLKKRNLATGSNLYKVENFEFRLSDALKLDDKGAPINKVEFEKALTIEEDSKNHKKLVEMLTALNDQATNFDVFFAKYFDKSNYLTWLSTSILMGNRDTVNQNFALYQPEGSDKFYFLPWDYDGALGFEGQPDIKAANNLYSQWQLSASNWWDVPLHRRFLQDPKHLAELKLAVEEIQTKYLTEAKLKAKLDGYKALVSPLIDSSPDKDGLPTISTDKHKEWDEEYQRIATIVKSNQETFLTALETPMPFYLAAELLAANEMRLGWDTAVDLQGDSVTYTVQVSTTPDFKAFVKNETTQATEIIIPKLSNGVYYLKVIAKDSKGNIQVAFDRTDIAGKTYFGVYDFEVKAGSVAGIN